MDGVADAADATAPEVGWWRSSAAVEADCKIVAVEATASCGGVHHGGWYSTAGGKCCGSTSTVLVPSGGCRRLRASRDRLTQRWMLEPPGDPNEPAHDEQLLFLDGGYPTWGAYVAEVWKTRGLVKMLARKDFSVKYRRATLGVLWALALPLLQAVILAVVLQRFVRFETPGPYVVFAYAGTLVFSFFSSSLNEGTASIVGQRAMSTRVYFPRVVLPLAAVASSFMGTIPAVVVLAIMVVVYGEAGAEMLLLVPACALALALVGALTSVLSAMHVYFRDVRYLVQAALVAWLYVTPVIYPLTAIGGLRPWIEANPLSGVVELFRAATVGADPTWGTAVIWSLGWTLVLTVVALELHRRRDRVFVDLL